MAAGLFYASVFLFKIDSQSLLWRESRMAEYFTGVALREVRVFSIEAASQGWVWLKSDALQQLLQKGRWAL